MNKYLIRLYRFLSSHIRGSLIYEDVRKVNLVNIFALLGTGFFSFYAVKSVFLGEPFLSIIYTISICIIIAMLVYLRFKRNTKLVSHVLVSGLMLIELFFLYRNGHVDLKLNDYYIFPGIYWYYVFPLFSIFLMGGKVGSFYNATLFSITLIFFSLNSPLNELYDYEFKVRFISIFLAIFVFAFFFEYIRHITFDAFIRSQKKKEIFLRKLSFRNEELRKKGVELSWLAEENRVQLDYVQELAEELKTQNDQISAQNLILENQSKEIQIQRDLLFQQNVSITDSINYASYIQKALFPNENLLRKNFKDYFILYKPRDIIGGDFYFVKKIEEVLIFSVADCTGHGVPGAMLSMLGIAFLTEITHQKEITKTCDVLEGMRERIKSSLERNDKKYDAKDSMDIALCAMNTRDLSLQFSGVNLPVYVIRNGELIVLSTTKMLIGFMYNNQEIGLTEFKLQKNDQVYMSTDGYEDQIGDASCKKFMNKRFQELLVEISSLSMAQQKEILEQKHSEWKGFKDQTDDILIVGLKI